MAGNDWLSGRAGDDLLEGGDGNDTFRGKDGHDWLFGGDGSDLLLGELQNDALKCGGGHDSLGGSLGADLFVFSATGPHGGQDRIYDGQDGIERVEITGGADHVALQITRQGTAVRVDYGNGVVLLADMVLSRIDAADLVLT